MPRRSTVRLKSPTHLADRVTQLQRRLADDRITGKADALLVTNPRDIRYLTGFVGDDSWVLVPLNPRARNVYVLSDFRFQEQIGREAPHVKAIIRDKGLIEELVKLLKRLKYDRIALQPDHVTLALRKKLAKELKASRLVEGEVGLLDQRAVKSADEVRAIRAALKIQQRAYLDTLAEVVKPGVREVEVAAFLEYRMRTLGADGPSFNTIVAADANAALPHAIPGETKLKKGGIVLIDWGARKGGYCSDLTRVVALDSMSVKIGEIYQLVLDAQRAAIAAIQPGAVLREVDKAARDVIEAEGYGEQFGHGTGHGIGLDIHESPTLSKRAEEGATLEVGHVVTVEPGIYLAGVGGVRIEDDVEVTAEGGRVLSDLPRDLESAIL